MKYHVHIMNICFHPCRGLIPHLAEGSAKATDSESTDDILNAALAHALRKRLCKVGDSIVALHRIGVASVIKIMEVKESVLKRT
jgi:pyruvate kinase